MSEVDNPTVEPTEAFYGKDDAELTEPTDELEAVAASNEAPIDDDTETPEQSDVEEDDATNTEGESDEPLIYQLGELEATEAELSEWKTAYDARKSMQSDYTRKTESAASVRKDAEALQATLSDKNSLLQAHIDRLEKLGTQELPAEEMAELRYTDESEYWRIKEQQEDNRKAIESAKNDSATALAAEDGARIIAEQGALAKAFPKWIDDKGQRTEQYSTDMNLMSDYMCSIGYSNDEMNQLENHKTWVMAHDAARYRELKKGDAAIRKKVKEAPRAVKPTLKTKPKAVHKDAADVFYG